MCGVDHPGVLSLDFLPVIAENNNHNNNNTKCSGISLLWTLSEGSALNLIGILITEVVFYIIVSYSIVIIY